MWLTTCSPLSHQSKIGRLRNDVYHDFSDFWSFPFQALKPALTSCQITVKMNPPTLLNVPLDVFVTVRAAVDGVFVMMRAAVNNVSVRSGSRQACNCFWNPVILGAESDE